MTNRKLTILFGGHYFLSSAWFLGNFWLIYVLSKGFSLTEAALLDVIFWGMVLISEIPTGFVADWFGRKTSVILSFLIQSVSIYIFAIANTLPMFLLSYGLWGFGITFSSGATEAWVYDEIIAQGGDESQYQSFYGRLLTFGFIASALAGYISGPLATIQLEYTIYATIAVFALDVLWLFLIPETKVELLEDDEKPSVKVAAKALIGKRITALGFLQLFTTGFVLSLIFWYQIFLDFRNVSYNSIAIILSTGGVILGLASYASAKFTGYFKLNSLAILSIFLGLSVLVMSISLPFAIAGYLVLHIVRGFWQPFFSKLVNELLPSRNRATSLSILGAITTITIVSMEYFSAWYIETYNFVQFFQLWGILIIIFILPITLYLKKQDLKLADFDISDDSKDPVIHISSDFTRDPTS